MKSALKYFFLFVFILSFQFLNARSNFSSSDSLQKYEGKYFWGAYVGVLSSSTMGKTNEMVEMNFGFKQLAFTGRFYRTWTQRPYFYENSFEAGWKKKFGNGFSNTLSGGYADLAFENLIVNHFIPETAPQNYHKRSGLVLEEKFCYNFHWKNSAPSVWGLAANYYCVFNEQQFVQGWAVGIDFILDNMYWQNPYTKTKRKHIVTVDHPTTPESQYSGLNNKSDTIPYKFRIRTNFITGMFFSPHVDFEHRYSKNWGWGFGVFVRPIQHELYGLLVSNPDIQLKGFGGFADWVFYKPVGRGNHYWSFGFRCGYRFLTGNCWYGEKLYEPDFYADHQRQDIVTAERVSFVMPSKHSNWSIDWYFTAGVRTSFYKTSQPGYATYFNPAGYFDFPTNGCYVLPEFAGGLEFGFGW